MNQELKVLNIDEDIIWHFTFPFKVILKSFKPIWIFTKGLTIISVAGQETFPTTQIKCISIDLSNLNSIEIMKSKNLKKVWSWNMGLEQAEQVEIKDN